MAEIASQRYEELVVTRKPYEDRAKTLSELTIPYLFVEDGSSESSDMADSYGGRYAGDAIAALANKMALALLPASGSSFKLEPDADALEQLTQGDANTRAEIFNVISKETNKVNKEIENQQIRTVFEAFLMQVIGVAPVVVEKIENDGIAYHSLRNFVVKLNKKGDAVEIVIKEELDPNDLPEGITVDEETTEDVELYTWCKIVDGKWEVTQSTGGEQVGDVSTFEKGELPYVYLGWIRQNGDTFHRPYAERHKGTIEDYGDLNRALVEGAVISSKTVFMVNPLGSTTKQSVSGAANGDIIDGRVDDVTTLQVGKNYDYQVAQQRLQELQQDIDRAFAVEAGASYAGRERVTAFEIQQDARKLDEKLSGFYSVMAKKFSKWLIKQVMKELKIKFDAIDVNVITGLDALGRNVEAQKLDNYVMRLANLGKIEWIKEEELVTRYAAYEGVDSNGLIKTPNEVQAERQQAAQAQASQALLESGAQQAGQNMANQAIPQQ
jgi:hypothetical protein